MSLREPVPLSAFFDAMGPYLRGETTLGDVESALGPSPSKDKDMAFYPWLMWTGWIRTLGAIFPTVRLLADAPSGGGWPSLAERYLRDHPPTDWALQEMGALFADWLEAQSDLPDSWSSVADYLWTRWKMRSSPDPEDDSGACLSLRQYPVDVVGIVRSVAADANAALPTPVPCTLVLYRHVDSHDVRRFTPSLGAIAAIAQLHGHVLEGALGAFSPEQLQEERGILERWGVVRPAALAVAS